VRNILLAILYLLSFAVIIAPTAVILMIKILTAELRAEFDSHPQLQGQLTRTLGLATMAWICSILALPWLNIRLLSQMSAAVFSMAFFGLILGASQYNPEKNIAEPPKLSGLQMLSLIPLALNIFWLVRMVQEGPVHNWLEAPWLTNEWPTSVQLQADTRQSQRQSRAGFNALDT